MADASNEAVLGQNDIAQDQTAHPESVSQVDMELDQSLIAEKDGSPQAPPGFVIRTESSTSILFAAPAPGTAPVFLNPVQEYNRDLSVVAIRTWSELRQQEKAKIWEKGVYKKWEKKRAKAQATAATSADPNHDASEPAGKKRKQDDGQAVPVTQDTTAANSTAEPEQTMDKTSQTTLTPPKFKFTLLEALSATGLRAIRYAKEIPLLRYVVANDLSASAVQDIRRNIEFNGLLPRAIENADLPSTSGPTLVDQDPKPKPTLSKAEIEDAKLGKVRPNEGDAILKMYMHRSEQDRFDCIDLDPYGSAVPFLDAAIGAVADGGLMCITCTDVAVFAGHNYPEKCFTHYGGVCVNAEFCHEVGLRLVLHSLATTAARYGRHIEPLLSLSIDFYVRLFIRVATSPKEVKSLPTKTSLLYYCVDCQAHTFQPLGRSSERASSKTGVSNTLYHAPAAAAIGDRCSHCNGKHHIGGPMWTGPIHNQEFVEQMLAHVEEHATDFKTADRIKGMVTVAKHELQEPLYFTPTRIAGSFNCTSPPLNLVASALLHGGYKVSRSHACAGSLKTDAPRTFVYDIMREWIKTHPVKQDNVKAGSPARRLLDGQQTHEVKLAPHPDVDKSLLSSVKLVRYQINPQAAWGPARAAVKGVQKGGGGKKGSTASAA